MSKFTRFLGGPNGPKICAGRTKTDFNNRGEEDLRRAAWAAKSSFGRQPRSTIPDIQGDQKTLKMVKKVSDTQTSIDSDFAPII